MAVWIVCENFEEIGAVLQAPNLPVPSSHLHLMPVSLWQYLQFVKGKNNKETLVLRHRFFQGGTVAFNCVQTENKWKKKGKTKTIWQTPPLTQQLCCLSSNPWVNLADNSCWLRSRPLNAWKAFRCGQILFDCHRIMKWVFMQPSAQFKLEQSSSTDGISNQSTTQARRGRHGANEFRRAEEISKKEATKTEPTSCNSFHYSFFPSFSLRLHFLKKNAETKDHKILTEGPLRASRSLTAKREEVIFREEFFFFFFLVWCFQQHHFPGEKEIN